VRKGLLIAANDKFNRQVESGEVIHVTPGAQSTNELSAYNQRDAWDEWCDRRDADMMAYQSRKYLPNDVYVGVSDLDRYGHWVDVEAYGPAWVPYYVDAYWSPYYDGRWVYRPFWGWTWVSYEPWGWLPYHYGSWYFATSFGWCWLPGPSFGFHFWSPGLARFHHGPGWVTWCPLGPGDYYDVNNYFFRNGYRYQLANMRLLQRRGPGDLANWNAPRSVRGLPMDEFVNGGPRSRGQIASDNPGLFRGGHGDMVTGALDVRPTARSFAPSPDRTPVRPVREIERPTFVRTEPSGDARKNGRFVRLPESSMSAGVRGPAPEMNGRSHETAPAGRSFGTALPGQRTEGRPADSTRQGGRNVENSKPTTWNRVPPAGATEPGRENQGRVYQTPPYRQPSTAASGRNTEDMRGQRPAAGSERSTIQQSPPRTYQPPQAPARKNEQVNPRTRPEPNAAPPRKPEYTTNWSSSSSRYTEAKNNWERTAAASPSTEAYRGSSIAPATPGRSLYSAPSVLRSESPRSSYASPNVRQLESQPSSGFRSMEQSNARSWGTVPGAGLRMSSPQIMRAPSQSFSAGTPRFGSAPRSGGFSRGASPQGRARR
jgi:hypothetical protein